MSNCRNRPAFDIPEDLTNSNACRDLTMRILKTSMISNIKQDIEFINDGIKMCIDNSVHCCADDLLSQYQMIKLTAEEKLNDLEKELTNMNTKGTTLWV